MRPVTMLTLVMVLALSGTAALAQSECAPAPAQPTATCQPCPPVATCQPAPTCAPVATCQPAPTSQAVCPQPCPIPAQFGCGPLPKITNLVCATDFDKAYIPAMYQHNMDIIAVASVGAEMAPSDDITDLAIKIRNERIQQNQKLALFARQAGYGALPVDYNEVAMYRNQLMGVAGMDFSARWATLMVGLLQQSQQSAQLAATRATLPQLRDQGNINARACANEIDALQRWLARNGLPVSATAVPGVCPPGAIAAPYGTGPSAPICQPTCQPTCQPAAQPTCPPGSQPAYPPAPVY